MNLSDRAMQVALTGEVPEDDPHIIADMMAEIDRLRAEVRLWEARIKEAAADVDEREAEIERLRAALPQVVDPKLDPSVKAWRWWCEACGTLTNTGDCDCTKFGHTRDKQRLLPVSALDEPETRE